MELAIDDAGIPADVAHQRPRHLDGTQRPAEADAGQGVRRRAGHHLDQGRHGHALGGAGIEAVAALSMAVSAADDGHRRTDPESRRSTSSRRLRPRERPDAVQLGFGGYNDVAPPG